jgi:hypothetical protein
MRLRELPALQMSLQGFPDAKLSSGSRPSQRPSSFGRRACLRLSATCDRADYFRGSGSMERSNASRSRTMAARRPADAIEDAHASQPANLSLIKPGPQNIFRTYEIIP